MKLYYYEYETDFYYPYTDTNAPFIILAGFLVESPAGLLNIPYRDEGWIQIHETFNIYKDTTSFVQWVQDRHNSKTAIVELK